MVEIKHRAIITVDFMIDGSIKYEYNLSPRSPSDVEDKIVAMIKSFKSEPAVASIPAPVAVDTAIKEEVLIPKLAPVKIKLAKKSK